MVWKNPLPNPLDVPDGDHPGAFGIQRKYDRHTGVDLYSERGVVVRAVEEGEVVAIFPFTGPEAESPWWLPTFAVMVEGVSGVVLYGEIEPVTTIWVGRRIKAGADIGHILPVLRHDKGKPTCMLHLELYVHGTRDAVWWRGGEKPESLLDPTELLKSCV